MSFNSVGFLIFLPVTVIIHYLLPHKVRWVWLLLASYFFYMTWRPEMALLIFSVTLVSYLGGLAAEHFRKKNNRAGTVLSGVISCGLSIGALIFFKYFGFLMENVAGLAALGGKTISVPDIVLPVGISFYTFQAIGYVIDVAKGKSGAEHHFGYYALFVSFFPQLVAGPIEKATDLIPRIKAEKKLNRQNVVSGLMKILLGFFKKIAVADMLAGPVNAIFADPEKAGSGLTALGAAMFAVQIFCDFSGYTDIAKGAAELLGIELSKNFDKPYSARSLNDFWRRWHISLSGWLRDYVYIPLGGNRKGEVRTCINLIIVFFVSGLWHGAAWHFIIWGLLHGVLIVFERLTRKLRDGLWTRIHVSPDGRFVLTLRRIVTFIVVCFLWIFFRAENMSEAFKVIGTVFSFKGGSAAGIFTDTASIFIAILSAVLLVLIDSGRIGYSLPVSEGLGQTNASRVKHVSPGVIILMIWTVALAWLLLSSSAATSAFIYFQF
ncbi:MAG: MBOAT family protein [Clostridia bacterium]|nr:MBOAT family protein [Clostridia bacterium]